MIAIRAVYPPEMIAFHGHGSGAVARRTIGTVTIPSSGNRNLVTVRITWSNPSRASFSVQSFHRKSVGDLGVVSWLAGSLSEESRSLSWLSFDVSLALRAAFGRLR
jgi:hypothetical protein